MKNLLNSFNVFCARRRWLKRIVRSFLSDIAYFDLLDDSMRVFFNPKDLTGPSFHLAYDLDRGFQNYEEVDKEEIVKCLPSNGIFVDVGANIGLFSLYVIKKCPNVQIYSFEPNSKVRKCLEKTKVYNKFNNLKIYSNAIGKNESNGKLFKSNNNDGGHSLNRNYEQIIVNEYEEVKIKPLDKLIILDGDKKVNVIKIDVEGAEKDVLEGAIELIKSDRPMMLIEILNRDLIDHKGIYKTLAMNFSEDITVRSPGSHEKRSLKQISDLADTNLSSGTEYNNYIFEFNSLNN
ncbi:MAG: FkbM family methyltransferase [Bacteriovoracaceae bacterium]|jgi:FkbM family methyltransferase|nr:FkbM family methyltransferase [Bacteriovoracaceae bacterium]